MPGTQATRHMLSTSERDQMVVAELVRTAFGGSRSIVPSTAYANVAAALLLYAAFSDTPNQTWFIGWLAVEIAYQVIRTVILHVYWSKPRNEGAAPMWGRVFVIQSFVNGGIWGAAGLIFYSPAFNEQQAVLAILLCGLAAGSIPVTAMLRWAFWGSAGMILMPYIARSFFEATKYHVIAAFMLTVFLAFMMNWGRWLNKLLAEAYAQRIENQVLLEQTNDAKLEAERANIAKSKFLAAASHDLRQPLHALTLFAGALLVEPEVSKVRQLGERIGTSISALSMLLNSLLDISKLEAGAISPKPSSFGAQDVFDRLFSEFDPLASRKNLRLRFRPTDAVFRTDEVLLERILRNFLANAIRYTERGTVFVGCRRQDDSWRLEVRDSGIGIPEDKHRSIFGEFVQLGNLERNQEKGLGLGLAIVSRLSLLLGCPIAIRSALGRGSTFSVTVAAGSAVIQTVQTSEPATSKDVKVLIIDDDASVRDAMVALLSAWRCDALAAESLADAIQKMAAASWKPDVVLCDLRLRDDEVGTAVLNQIRERIDADVRCVLITGDTATDRLKLMQESGYPVLHKPVSPSRLRALIGSLTLEPQPA